MKKWETLQRHFVLWLLMAQTHPLTGGASVIGATNRRLGASDSASDRCENGRIKDGACLCDPCWEGPNCLRYVDMYPPRFLIHAATVVLPVNASGTVYRAWSTDDDLGLTCPLGPGESARCPCASVTYQLFSGPGDRNFDLDPDTGVLTRSSSAALTGLQPGRSYKYKIMVQGVQEGKEKMDLQYDLLDLKVYVTEDHVKKIPWT